MLLEGLQQEVEQCRPGLRLDVAIQCGQRGPVALDQLGDDRRIGVDLHGLGGDRRRPGWRVGVRGHGQEAVTLGDRPQGMADQRIPTETYTWFSASSACGIGNSVVIGRLCTIQTSPSARHHSMSCEHPRCAAIRRPSDESPDLRVREHRLALPRRRDDLTVAHRVGLGVHAA